MPSGLWAIIGAYAAATKQHALGTEQAAEHGRKLAETLRHGPFIDGESGPSHDHRGPLGVGSRPVCNPDD